MQNNPNRVRWDVFVTNTSNTKGALPSRPLVVRNRQKALPPVRTSNPIPRVTQSADRKTTVKPAALPPIDNNKKNPPIVFILSKPFSLENRFNCFLLGLSSSTKLCSRLIERYNQINYLYINDIANIDEDDHIGKNLFFSNTKKKSEFKF